MQHEKQNALLVENILKLSVGPDPLGIRELLVICAVIRLGRPPGRAVAKTLGKNVAGTSGQLTHLVAKGFLRAERDDIYFVLHYEPTPKALALFTSPAIKAPVEA